MTVSGDYYEFLGLNPDTSAEDIKKAYRTLSLRYHPDTGSEKDDEKMKKLNLIYSVLRDPVQRSQYNDSTAFRRSGYGNGQKSNVDRHSNQSAPEDYSVAIFVDGIEARDAAGTSSYIRPGDYVYYKVSLDKKILFWSYSGSDIYRTKVLKIYSKKRNNFRKAPLFVVRYQDIDHIIFELDFMRNWLTEKGYRITERRSAAKTLTVGLGVLAIIAYMIMTAS